MNRNPQFGSPFLLGFEHIERLIERTAKAATGVPGHSTCWVSPTTGGDPSAVTGSSSSRRPATDSAERCGASTPGVEIIGTGRSGSNSRS